MPSNEDSSLESTVYPTKSVAKEHGAGWLRLSAVAAASALAGGLAAAWYYRKTLNTLRHAESVEAAHDFGITDHHTEEDA